MVCRHDTTHTVLRQTPNNVTRLCFVVRVYRTHAQPVTTRFSPDGQPHTKQHSFSRLLVWRIHVSKKLLRKEVIQPHLPVRLPCYDFVPIADPTFDTTPHKVEQAASGVTNFHDVTGGVYKARERIHRSVADLRLLATPTSWGRVADPNPN